MTYKFKVPILTLCIFVLSYLGITLWSSRYESVDEKAYKYYENSNLNLAFAYTEELEKYSSSAKYSLYQGYILRKKGNLEHSTLRLKKALKLNKSAYLLSEIHLNLCLNAYLQHDIALFQESLKTLWQTTEITRVKSVSQYTDLFKGIEAYLNKDYEKAYVLLQKTKEFSHLSPWMKNSFENEFNPVWFHKHLACCLIEESHFAKAIRILNDMEALELTEEQRDHVYFLRALCHFKEAENKSQVSKSTCHQKGILEINKIKNKKLVAKDLKIITTKLENELLHNLENNQMSDYKLNLQVLDLNLNEHEKDDIAFKICLKIETLLANGNTDAVLSALNHSPENFRVKLLYTLNTFKKKAIEQCDYKLLRAHYNLMALVSENEIEFLNFKAQIINYAFIYLKNKNNYDQGTGLLSFWMHLENNPEIRVKAAEKLVDLGATLWRDDANYIHAIALFKKALELTENESSIFNLIEKKVSNLYKAAQNKDAVEQYLPLLEAVKTLQLQTVNIYNLTEKKQQLDDAEAFFLKGHYKLAKQKALFVLALEPKNERANRIAGLIAYDSKNYNEAIFHLTQVKLKDAIVKDILKQVTKKELN
jgi:hypothetical protein